MRRFKSTDDCRLVGWLSFGSTAQIRHNELVKRFLVLKQSINYFRFSQSRSVKRETNKTTLFFRDDFLFRSILLTKSERETIIEFSNLDLLCNYPTKSIASLFLSRFDLVERINQKRKSSRKNKVVLFVSRLTECDCEKLKEFIGR